MKASSDVPHFKVIKRDGRKVPFNRERIVRAIALATYSTLVSDNNPRRDRGEERYGLSEDAFQDVVRTADAVQADLVQQFGTAGEPSVENVQDFVEIALLKAGNIEVVRRYIGYRATHAELRPVKHAESGLQDYIALSRYCRVRDDLGRREVWSEAADRVRDMHLRRFADLLHVDLGEVSRKLIADGVVSAESVAKLPELSSLSTHLLDAFDGVSQKAVLPSMRSLQFGGPAIEAHEARMFNCTFSPVNRLDWFKEYFYLLLAGSGCGFSVQTHHVAQLPALPAAKSIAEWPVQYHTIADSIEGWAMALDALIRGAFNGVYVEFDYSLIRPINSLLKTSGGRAPGHVPLKRALEQARGILEKAVGRKMRPIEVYDIAMFTAKAVLSGGIRRSATICLFSADDEEMRTAKTGKWNETDPQRAASNNSAVIVRGEATRATFDRLYEAQKEFGEPGFFFVNDTEYGANPCCEILLHPRLVVTPKDVEKLRRYGYEGELNVGDVLYGWQFCNLCTINGGLATTPEAFYRMTAQSALIGTLQAHYTNVPFLGPVTRVLNEREALLGVSICGILDRPEVLLEPQILRAGADVAKAMNAIVAAAIGISRAARVTTVKPEGTSSLLLGCGSGAHPHHARRYFRRVQANRGDKVYQEFARINAHMTELSVYDANKMTDAITFPVEAPDGAMLRDDLTAIRHLEIARIIAVNWVHAGRASTTYTDGHHNVSLTVSVAPDEWDSVCEWIWENSHLLTGISLAKASGDKEWAQVPREAVVTPDDIRRWNSLRYNPVDYRSIRETDLAAGEEYRGAAAACSGGACELAV